MLPQLETLLRASPKVVAVHVVDNDPIDDRNFLFKIRCELIPGHVLQIRLHAVDGNLRYSYQEFSNGPLRRWDNAPHFPHVPHFPHHHHDLHGHVVQSELTGDPIVVLDAL